MPTMPRPKKAQKLSDAIMKKMGAEKNKGKQLDRFKEAEFDSSVRTMIKR